MRQRIARIGRWGAGLVLALAAVSAWAGEVLGLRAARLMEEDNAEPTEPKKRR